MLVNTGKFVILRNISIYTYIIYLCIFVRSLYRRVCIYSPKGIEIKTVVYFYNCVTWMCRTSFCVVIGNLYNHVFDER